MHAPCSAEAGCPLPRLKETKTPSYRNTNSLARSEISPNCSAASAPFAEWISGLALQVLLLYSCHAAAMQLAVQLAAKLLGLHSFFESKFEKKETTEIEH